MGNETIDLRESESIGVVYKVSSEGIVFIFTPGYFPDPYIDQRLTPPGNRYALGDFIALKFDEANIVRSHKKTDPVLRVEVDGDRILVETQIAFYPSTGEYGMREEALTGNAAWSPDFNVVLCEAGVISQPRRDHMYTVWLQRLEGHLLLMDQPVFWKVSNKKPSSEPISQFSLSKAPWNKHRRRHSTRRYFPHRPSTEILKQYARDSFEGVVVRTIEENAIVWSAAIPISEVLFLFGEREGMVVGDWIRFNCEVAIRVQHNCFLEGKKFEIIAPILPVHQVNNTVVAELSLNVPDSNSGVIRHRRDVVTVQSPTLGPIEFPSGIFRDSFYGETLKIRVIKISKTSNTGASWRFDKFVCSDEEATVTSLPSKSVTGLSRFSQMEVQHGFRTNGSTITADFNFPPPLIPQTISREPAFGGQRIGGDEELLGVITGINGEMISVWTNKFGDVIWNSRSSSQLSGPVVPVIGRWLSYRNYTIEKATSISQSIISGVPEPIAPVLPTRVIGGHVQVQTKVTEVERCINGVQMASSDDVGRTAVTSGVFLKDSRGRYDYRDVFLVWVVHTSGSPTWKVVEVVKMCNASASNMATEAEETYSDDDSWGQFEEMFGDVIPSIDSTTTRNSPPITTMPRQLNQHFSSVPSNSGTPSVISVGRRFGRQPSTTHFSASFSSYNPPMDQGVFRTVGGFQRMNISESGDNRRIMAMQHSQRATESGAAHMEGASSSLDAFLSPQPRHGFQQDISRASTVQAAGREVASNSPRDMNVSSTVNLTEENDPLGPPIFGAVKPVPIHNLLSPPLESSSDGEESRNPQDEPTTSDPNVTALPSFDDCIKRLWKIAQVRRTVATLDTDLYFDLSRHMKERGWRVGDELSDFPL